MSDTDPVLPDEELNVEEPDEYSAEPENSKGNQDPEAPSGFSVDYDDEDQS